MVFLFSILQLSQFTLLTSFLSVIPSSSAFIPTSVSHGTFGVQQPPHCLFRVGSSNDQNDNGRSKTLLELPAKNVKIGALRFLLNIVLVGEQNNPEPKSWMTKQVDSGDLQVYYSDGTGMLSVQFKEYGLTFQRHGTQPSLTYQLQESILLHKILDELRSVAMDVLEEGVAKEKRLLILQDNESIDRAREKLPARVF